MIKDKVKEFLTLSYKEPGTRFSGLSDLNIGHYIIARKSRPGLDIIYLFNGTHIYIDWRWLDMFSSLSIWGEEIIRRYEPEDKVERTVIRFLDLNDVLQCSITDTDNFLDCIGDICSIGSHPFIDWLEEEDLNNFKLGPFRISSPSIDKKL